LKIDFVATRKNVDPSERELYEMDFMLGALGFKRAFMDLGLQTVASCTPRHHDVRFFDEYLGPIPYDTDADIVALSAKTSCATRAYMVADEFRRRGKTVVMGGIHASLRPQEALQHADIVVDGEAEEIWPKVIEDLESRRRKTQLYKADGFPSMDGIPTPRWDFVDQKQYFYRQLQTTRGCPFMCRFCSVPDISGQAFRFKPVECVIREITAIPREGGPIAEARPLYVVDDNFISRPSYTKELLRAMIPLRQRGQIMDWSAETTLNVAKDTELLDLLVKAGCTVLIIGFESVTEETLADMNKSVNFCMSYQDACAAILERGISIVGNFIVGFDTDSVRVFRDTIEFIRTNGIMYPFFSILTPMPGTKLFDDMKAEGRLDHERWDLYDTRHVVFEPKQMTRDQLMDGYIWLYEQAYGPDLTLERLESWWSRRSDGGSSAAERAFLAARTAPSAYRGDEAYRRFWRDAMKLNFNPRLSSEIGQLLYMLDSHHFARFMRRFSTVHRERNYQIFRSPERYEDQRSMQWDKVAKKRQARLRVVSA